MSSDRVFLCVIALTVMLISVLQAWRCMAQARRAAAGRLHVIECDQPLRPEVVAQMRESWKRLHGENAPKLCILPSGMKYREVGGVTPAQLDSLYAKAPHLARCEHANPAEARFCKVCGMAVPPTAAGLMAASNGPFVLRLRGSRRFDESGNRSVQSETVIPNALLYEIDYGSRRLTFDVRPGREPPTFELDTAAFERGMRAAEAQLHQFGAAVRGAGFTAPDWTDIEPPLSR